MLQTPVEKQISNGFFVQNSYIVNWYSKSDTLLDSYKAKDYKYFETNIEDVNRHTYNTKIDNPLVQLAVDLELDDFVQYFADNDYSIPEMSNNAKRLRGIKVTQPDRIGKTPRDYLRGSRTIQEDSTEENVRYETKQPSSAQLVIEPDRKIPTANEKILFSFFHANTNTFRRYPPLESLYESYKTNTYKYFVQNIENVNKHTYNTKINNPLVQLAVDLQLQDFVQYFSDNGYTIPNMSSSAMKNKGTTSSSLRDLIIQEATQGTNKNLQNQIISLVKSVPSSELQQNFDLALASGNISLINLMIRVLYKRDDMSEEYLTSKLGYTNIFNLTWTPKNVNKVMELLFEYGADVYRINNIYNSVLKKQYNMRAKMEQYDFSKYHDKVQHLCAELRNESQVEDIRKIALAMGVRVRSFENSKYLNKLELCSLISGYIDTRFAADEGMRTPSMRVDGKISE